MSDNGVLPAAPATAAEAVTAEADMYSDNVVTPLWEVVEDLAIRIPETGDPKLTEARSLITRAALLLKGD